MRKSEFRRCEVLSPLTNFWGFSFLIYKLKRLNSSHWCTSEYPKELVKLDSWSLPQTSWIRIQGEGQPCVLIWSPGDERYIKVIAMLSFLLPKGLSLSVLSLTSSQAWLEIMRQLYSHQVGLVLGSYFGLGFHGLEFITRQCRLRSILFKNLLKIFLAKVWLPVNITIDLSFASGKM